MTKWSRSVVVSRYGPDAGSLQPVYRLVNAAELIDGPLDPGTLAGNLRDLARVNRWLGGVTLSLRALRTLAGPNERLRVLDVGTGDAEVPKQLFRSTAYSWPNLELTATDVRPEIVTLARRNVGRYPVIVKLAALHHIDEPDSSFDVVHSSLLLHHLEPAEAVALLREMARVASRAVIINDLDRAPHWLLGARLLTALLMRNRYTRNDAPLSVRRAYRPHEVVELAARAGLGKETLLWTQPRYRYALVLSSTEHSRA